MQWGGFVLHGSSPHQPLPTHQLSTTESTFVPASHLPKVQVLPFNPGSRFWWVDLLLSCWYSVSRDTLIKHLGTQYVHLLHEASRGVSGLAPTCDSGLSPLASELRHLLGKKRLKFSGSVVETGRVLAIRVPWLTLSFNLAYLGPAGMEGMWVCSHVGRWDHLSLQHEWDRGSNRIPCCCSVAQSCLTLRPHGLQHARLPCLHQTLQLSSVMVIIQLKSWISRVTTPTRISLSILPF